MPGFNSFLPETLKYWVVVQQGLVLPQKEKVPLIDQPRIPSFPIELVKTKSDFIVRLVEMGLGR